MRPPLGYKAAMDVSPASPLPEVARLFLALWPTPPVRAAIAGGRDAWWWPPAARLVQRDRLHLTLHFIGAVRRERLPELHQGLAVAFEPFEIVGGPPEVWRHGVAVQRLEQAPPGLLQLHAALGAALRGLALPVETRPFAPHLTLARHAAGAVGPAAGAPWRWAVHGYRLVESLPGGAGYVALARYPARRPSARRSSAKAST